MNKFDEATMMAALIDGAGFELGLSGGDSLFIEDELLGDPLIPGCGDLQVASVSRIGHREDFPMSREWETLIALLSPGQELLWIVSKREGKLRCHLALKDLRTPRRHPEDVKEVRHEFRALLDHFSRRAFPESMADELSDCDTEQLFREILSCGRQEVVVTSGQPSPSDIEDSRDFPEQRQRPVPDGMLNDIVEPFSGEPEFTIVFTVGRVENSVVTEEIASMADLRTAISPLLKIQTGESRSRTDSKNTAKQTGQTKTTGQNTARNAFIAIFQKFFGSRADEVLDTYSRHVHDPKYSIVPNLAFRGIKGSYRGLYQKLLKKSATSHQVSDSRSETVSTGTSLQSGTSRNTTHANATLELVDQGLQESIRGLKKASGTGGYHLAAEVFSPRTELSLRIARAVMGSLSGAKTHLRPFQTAIYRGKGFANHLTRRCNLDEVYGAITLQSRHIASLFLPLPESDLPGLKTKRNVFYGKPNPTDEPEDPTTSQVWLGELAHLKSGFSPRFHGHAASFRPSSAFKIPANDVASHILVAGTTGSGKTQRSASILNQLPSDHFQVIIIESAKKTYRSLLNREGVKRRVLTLGDASSGGKTLRLNPFFFEPDTDLRRHVSVLSDALADLLPVEALVGPKIREAIQNCYENYGWDIQNGKFREDGDPAYPTMADLHMEVMSVAANLKFGPEVNSNYKGALLGRTRLFIDSLYQDIFGWGGDESLESLFGEDDVIIEMDSLPPSEAKVPSFVISLLLERMRSRQEKLNQGSRTRDLLIVIEEAHNLLDRRLEAERPGMEMGSGGFLLKQIVRLLQEGREIGMGMMVVDQSPASLADAVIRNTNTKIILRISDSEEAEKIGATLGLTKEESRDLHDLEDGESVIKVKHAGKALKLAPCHIVERIHGGIGSSDSIKVDYYTASAKIRELLNILSQPPSYDSSLEAIRTLEELIACGGGDPSATNYLARRLLAAVSEVSDSTVRLGRAQFSDPAILLLEVNRMWHSVSTTALAEQLVAVLSKLPWSEAAKSFKVDASPAIPACVEFLKLDAHWNLLSAADRIGELLLSLQQQHEPPTGSEIQYSQLLGLVHLGQRLHAIKKLSINLIQRPS